MKYYYLISLGCPKNLVDSEIFAGIIEKQNYHRVMDPHKAEVIIVNTCGFILDAKQEAIDTILEMSEYKKENCRKLIVTGCLVKRYFDDLQRDLPEIDELINLKDFNRFAKLFNAQAPYIRHQLTPAHYAYLRISDGCNNACSYCAIPGIRGCLKSEKQQELINQAESMADAGVKELIITAQDTTQYGKDLADGSNLMKLLRELELISGFEWIRLLYLHPAHLEDELIDYICQSKKICHYFEIPMQHANNRILELMNRRVTKKRMNEIVKRIRQNDPDSVIRTTFIVGHPGETEADFEELLDFIEEMRFERIGVFTYSEEEGTRSAVILDKIDQDTAELRKDQIMGVQMEISRQIMYRYQNKVVRVIIDEKSEDQDFDFVGRTKGDCPEIDGFVYLYGHAVIGEIRDVKIIDTWEYDLVGKIIEFKGEKY